MSLQALMNIYCRRFPIYQICHLNFDGGYNIYVYGDELKIPVFHIVSTQIYEDIAICIFEPRYYQNTFDKDVEFRILIDRLNEALKEPNTKYPHLNRTNWETIAYFWDMFHSTILPDKYKNATQPDYNMLDKNKMVRRSFKQMLLAKLYA